MSAQILYMISANKKTSAQVQFVIPDLSVSGLGKYIRSLENKKIVWSGWYKQPATKIVIAIHNRLAYTFLIYALRKRVFSLSLKKPKWFRFRNLRMKQIQPITDQYHICLFCQSFSKSMCTFI